MNRQGVEIIKGKAGSGKTARLTRMAREFMEAGGYCIYLDVECGPMVALGRILRPWAGRPEWLAERLVLAMAPSEELDTLLDRPEKSKLAEMVKENHARKILVCIDGIWLGDNNKPMDERLDWLAEIHRANPNIVFAVTMNK